MVFSTDIFTIFTSQDLGVTPSDDLIFHILHLNKSFHILGNFPAFGRYPEGRLSQTQAAFLLPPPVVYLAHTWSLLTGWEPSGKLLHAHFVSSAKDSP